MKKNLTSSIVPLEVLASIIQRKNWQEMETWGGRGAGERYEGVREEIKAWPGEYFMIVSDEY